MKDERSLLGVTGDAVVTKRFFSLKPQILLIERLDEILNEKEFALPGGHMEAGKFTPNQFSFEDGDESIWNTVTRELFEETNLDLRYSKIEDWTELPIRTMNNRDPRDDYRRISSPWWIDVPLSLLMTTKIKAADDAKNAYWTNLLDLTPYHMGFDHWWIIHWLQKKWRKYAKIWHSYNHPKYGPRYRHKCMTMPGNLEILYNGPGGKGNIVYPIILEANQKPAVELLISFCPFCGADFSIKPITDTSS